MPSTLAGSVDETEDELSFAIVAMVDRSGRRRLVASMPRRPTFACRTGAAAPHDDLALRLMQLSSDDAFFSGSIH